MTIRVVIADDHTLVRAGLRELLASLPGIEVVGEAADGRAALSLIAERVPDVVLLDVGMPDLNGLEVAGRVAALDAGIRVVILSMHTSEEYVLRALRAGAAGYLVKGSTVAELEQAIRAVARGETFLSPVVSQEVLDAYLRRTGGAADPLAALTPRQREILQAVAEGRSSREIADRLGLSLRTVETHRAQIMDRLGERDLAGLVRFAVRVGLVTPGS
jgi:DNA-binding NarL/FixJ family response regulator